MAYFTVVKLKNFIGNIINPATEEKQDVQILNNLTSTQASSDEATLLRRLVHMLESNAVTDSNKRQKIVVEAMTSTGLGLPVYGPASGQIYPSTNYPTANAPTQSPSLVYWQPVWIGPVDQRYQIKDAARMAYATSTRANLIFT